MAYNKKNTPMNGEIDVSALCVAERLKELRNKHNLTQTDVANVLNISTREYWRFEQQNYCTRYANILWLALFYNVSIDFLFGLTNEQNKVYDEETYPGYFNIPGLMNLGIQIPNVKEYKKQKNETKE